jgi:serine/threonine-protein kinase
VLVLALAGGGTYASIRLKVFTPTKKLASVVGDQVTVATATLKHQEMTPVVGSMVYSPALTSSGQIVQPVASGDVISQSPAAGVVRKEGTKVALTVSKGPPPEPVPSLAGFKGSCAAVIAKLKAVDLTADCTTASSTTVDYGTVISYSPDTTAIEGSTVAVSVSSGPPVEDIANLAGSTCNGATVALQADGLKANCVNQTSSTVPTGQVISWTPTGTATEGSTITVNVSTGPPMVDVPTNLTQLSVSQAAQALTQAGLGETLVGPVFGTVYAANPPEGTSVPVGTTVTIYSR